MSAEADLARDVVDRQVQMFAMFVGPGLTTTRAALAAASKVPDSTLKSWANGAAMPLWAVMHLRRFLPPEAINMLTEPAGLLFAGITPSDSDWDEILHGAAGLTFEIVEAKKDGICHRDRDRLRGRARALAADLADVIED